MDAHTISNRIMRRENYIIAMFNKDVLDLSVPIPFIEEKQWLTNMIQDYIIGFGIFGYVYDTKGNFRKRFLKEENKAGLALGLQKRFKSMVTLEQINLLYRLYFH